MSSTRSDFGPESGRRRQQPSGSRLYEEHPDWFLRDTAGRPYRIAEVNGFLDFTRPEAVEYMDRTLGVILGEWGMDCTKMDFWTQNFEDRDGRFGVSSATSLDTRKVLFDLIRKYLPDDGILMTRVATGIWNPFIGTHADTYRNALDIGAGTWQEQV